VEDDDERAGDEDGEDDVPVDRGALRRILLAAVFVRQWHPSPIHSLRIVVRRQLIFGGWLLRPLIAPRNSIPKLYNCLMQFSARPSPRQSRVTVISPTRLRGDIDRAGRCRAEGRSSALCADGKTVRSSVGRPQWGNRSRPGTVDISCRRMSPAGGSGWIWTGISKWIHPQETSVTTRTPVAPRTPRASRTPLTPRTPRASRSQTRRVGGDCVLFGSVSGRSPSTSSMRV